ncbi:24609_t:CDS:2 [Gigaspora margarita]|uniref:24609_t:CDS:1 n=1 Tax=Gigaspora margarita TaxID=4874 RepID=A0ABN7VED3_GIGMA|nr:24609_t:CDS:2 [Gigaspora margarita]
MDLPNILLPIERLLQKPGKDKTKMGPVAVYKTCKKKIAFDKCAKIAEIIRTFPPVKAMAEIKSTLSQGNSAFQWVMVSPGLSTRKRLPKKRPSSPRKLSKQRRVYKDSEKQEAIQDAPLNIIERWPDCLLPPSVYFSTSFDIMNL